MRAALTRRVFIAANPIWVLLPGFDGAGFLFAPLVRALPPQIKTEIISYAFDKAQDYQALRHEVERSLPHEPFILVAESYSGPLALQIANKGMENLKGVVLAASFIQNPFPWMKWWLKMPLFYRMLPARAPSWFVRRYLVGAHADKKLLHAVEAALHHLDKATLISRLSSLTTLDARELLKKCPVPILCLQPHEDQLLPASVFQQIKLWRPDVHIAPLPGPHMVLQAMPEFAVKVILKFVRDLNT